jgi:hypothetical protein
MLFVPEGEYLLKVTNAADGVVENGTFVPRHVYADAEQPLQVTRDVSGVTVKVPEPAGHRP